MASKSEDYLLIEDDPVIRQLNQEHKCQFFSTFTKCSFCALVGLLFALTFAFFYHHHSKNNKTGKYKIEQVANLTAFKKKERHNKLEEVIEIF